MLAEFLEQDHRKQMGTGPTARGDMERRRRLADALAIAVSKFLSHRLDHLPAPRDNFQCLGDVLAQLGQARTTAATACRRAGLDEPLARQVRGEGLARGAIAGKRRYLAGFCSSSLAANSSSVADASNSSSCNSI